LTLAEPITDALRRVELALGVAARFDAATARQHFKLRGVDYVGYLIIPPLLASLARTAPGVTVRCLDAQTGSVAELLRKDTSILPSRSCTDLDYPVARSFCCASGTWSSPAPLIRRSMRVPAPRRRNVRSRSLLPIAACAPLIHRWNNWQRRCRARGDESQPPCRLQRSAFLSIARAGGRLGHDRHFSRAPGEAHRADARLNVYLAPIELAPISLGMIWHRRNDSEPARPGSGNR